MNFGEWDNNEVLKTKNKLDVFYNLMEDSTKKINSLIDEKYQEYCDNYKSNCNFFKIIFFHQLNKSTFIEKTCTFSNDKPISDNSEPVALYLHEGDSLQKYDVSEFKEEHYALMDFLYYNYYFDSSNFGKFRLLEEKMDYCIGGEINDDEIYVLCQLDNYINKLTELLSNIK